MRKRLVSLLLTLALLVLPVVSAGAAQPDPTLVQTQTETAEAAQHQYSYIALGDSIVAGIGPAGCGLPAERPVLRCVRQLPGLL